MTKSAWSGWIVGTLLCTGIALVSFRYLVDATHLPAFVSRHLFFKLIETNAFRHPWLTVHVACAASALLVGPLQVLPGIRRRVPTLHHWIGRTYVLGCLLGGIAGLVLALGAATGPVSTAGFGLLAVAWFFATGAAWQLATQRRFEQHREWMTRSFSLTLSAVTLRIYLGLMHLAPFIAYEDAYRAISFLCWVPNLVLAELYVRATRKRAPSITPMISAPAVHQ